MGKRKPENVTNLHDARFFRQKGLPPVVEHTFSKEYELELMKAHYYFMDGVYDFASDGKKARTIGQHLLMMRKFKDLMRKFNDLKREVHRCDAFVGKRMRGNPQDPKDPRSYDTGALCS